MKKRILAFTLTLVMMATMLAGCGGKKEEPAAPAESQGTEEHANTEEPAVELTATQKIIAEAEGMSLEELYRWCEDNKLHLCHWFTVDDLVYLKRGGRVSAATALLGSMLQIKPVLHVDNEGHLISVSKVRGRKSSIEALAKKLGETGLPGQNDTVFICHGDCLEDAKYLEKLVKEKYGVKEVLTYYTGAVIGAHSGPGTLALFYMGEHR